MKTKLILKEIAQVLVVVSLTAGVAHAIQPQTPLTSTSQVAAEQVDTEVKAPEAVSEPAQAVPETKPAEAPAVVETPPVQAPVQPEPTIKVTGNSQIWLQESGIPQQYWRAVDFIVGKESGWCPYNWQGEVGYCRDYHGTPEGEVGYGLCQSTPAGKMAAAGADWATNPVTQLKWCNMHANSHHANWGAAYNYWVANRNW